MFSSFRNHMIRRISSVNRLTISVNTMPLLSLNKTHLYQNITSRMMSSSTENNENNNNNTTDDKQKSQSDNSAQTNSNPDQELIAKLQKEVKDLKDQVIRSYAEEENVRRIAKRDVENAKSYANEKMAKAMLDVADNLDRALAAIPIEERTAESSLENSTLSTFIEGITMTEKNLQKIFVQFNIIKYGQIGDTFNPSLHDALFQIPDASKEAGTIGQVLKSGYKLKDRVIRAAQVGTNVKP